ncbi:MAG TPA: hypothetical protein VD948_04840, partial [Rhodothermales bacterium]|nr:hypothetical protein [Rhodothermales bacterium]
MQPVPVRFQIPDAFRAKAWYALEELLGGLGLCPVEAGAEAPALIYGPEAHANAIWLPFTEGTLSPFEVGGVIPEAPRSWRLHDGTQIPIAFGTAEAPDLIASAFLWLSGWAEHRSAHRDRHGRVPFAASLAARWGVPPSLPVVDAYRATLADQLYSSGFSVAITDPPPTAPWALCVTCDVDHVRYGRLRRAARTLASGRVTEALRVVSAWARPARDPFRHALVHIAETTVARGGRATFLFKAGATDPH